MARLSKAALVVLVTAGLLWSALEWRAPSHLGQAEVSAQARDWQLKPAERKWDTICWTEDTARALDVARERGVPLFVFRSGGPIGKG